ncbi:MAG: glutamate racemase [Calditrichia bacterium]
MSSEISKRPIGIFDSGIGGLTVVKELIEILPHENLVYFGDTARLPYGTKSEDSVKRFGLEDSYYLLEHKVKMIVVACNTVSATALPLLREHFDIPVIGVIEPGVEKAISVSRTGNIGIIGTATTIRSGRYRAELVRRNPDLRIIEQPCPLFVPLVEEGLIEDEATYIIARRYLTPLIENHVDTVVLGCTHYPVLKEVIRKIMGEDVVLVDSGEAAAGKVKEILADKNMINHQTRRPKQKFYVSDLPFKFQDIAERFLQKSLPHIELIDFDQFLVKKGKKFQQLIDNLILQDY